MSQRIAAFYHYDVKEITDQIEKDRKPEERIAHISHAQSVVFDYQRDNPMVSHNYSAIVVFESEEGTKKDQAETGGYPHE
jgi:hypothetical protein